MLKSSKRAEERRKWILGRTFPEILMETKMLRIKMNGIWKSKGGAKGQIEELIKGKVEKSCRWWENLYDTRNLGNESGGI